MVREYSKLMLRAYNAEADNLVRALKPYKLATSVDRLEKVACYRAGGRSAHLARNVRLRPRVKVRLPQRTNDSRPISVVPACPVRHDQPH